ncbi:hypothetical protein [Bilophila wadsworthia]|uniref:hypothetical protein n=1 Tax=Bilophila wadsworthia TaxID=35833 RepID=UPI00266EC523|nr:hypothetical protein [Bilophila wadsworthia]
MNLYDGNGCQFLPLAKELRQIAEILEARGMSAELINMTLAARAGLPVAPVDPKSPIFVWEKGEECKVSAPEAQPRSLNERREAVFQAIEGLDVEGIMEVLAPPLNRVLVCCGLVATIELHDVSSCK